MSRLPYDFDDIQPNDYNVDWHEGMITWLEPWQQLRLYIYICLGMDIILLMIHSVTVNIIDTRVWWFDSCLTYHLKVYGMTPHLGTHIYVDDFMWWLSSWLNTPWLILRIWLDALRVLNCRTRGFTMHIHAFTPGILLCIAPQVGTHREAVWGITPPPVATDMRSWFSSPVHL